MAMKVADEAAMTRQALVSAARRLFRENGFARTGVGAIVSEAGVTRGALYHHFPDKRALLEEALREVQRGLLDRVQKAAMVPGGCWPMLRAAIGALLEAAPEPDVAVLMLREAPAVLGWARWREFDGGGHADAIAKLLRRAMADGEIPAQPLEPLVHLIRALVTEAAIVVSVAEDPAAARASVEQSLWLLLDSIRRGPADAAEGEADA